MAFIIGSMYGVLIALIVGVIVLINNSEVGKD
jgi:hypothetical protein